MKSSKIIKFNVKTIQYFSLLLYLIGISAFQLPRAFDSAFVIISFVLLTFSSLILEEKIKISKLVIWTLLFWGYYFLTLFWCNNSNDTLELVNPAIQIIILAFCLSNIVKNNEDIEKIFKYIIISMLVTSILIIIRTPFSYYGVVRIGGATGLHYNNIGIRLAIAALLCMYFFRKKDLSFKKKIFYIVCFLIFVILAFLTGSKKAVIIVIAGYIFYELFIAKGIKFVLKMILIPIILLGVYIIMMSNSYTRNVIGNRFSTLFETVISDSKSDRSYIERSYYISEAKYLFKQNTVLGYGGNNFVSYMRNIGYRHIAYSHNNFYELLATLGLIGFIIYYTFYIKLIINLIKCYKAENSRLVLFYLILMIINIILDYARVCYQTSFNLIVLFIAYFIADIYNKKNKKLIDQ